MIQSILTDALSLLTVAGTAAFAVAFVHEYAAWKSRKAFRVAETAEALEQAAAAIVQAVQEEIASDYHPSIYAHKTIAPEAVLEVSIFDTMGRDELRAECQRHGIRWSHVRKTANGKKRHLSVAEMREALKAR